MEAATEQRLPEYTYDFVHLLSRVVLIHANELAWDTYFRESGIRPFTLVYEDFFADLDRQLPRLVAYLGGLPRKRIPIKTDTSFRIQRSEETYNSNSAFVPTCCAGDHTTSPWNWVLPSCAGRTPCLGWQR